MVIYSITYFINALGFYTNKLSAKHIKILTLLLLVFISGTRYYMGGNDVLVYEGAYNNVSDPGTILTYIFTGENENNAVNINYEPGFLLFCSAVKMMGFSYFGFILIWTILFYFLMVHGLKDFVPSWSVFFAVFMYKLMFYDTFVSIRQGLTIAIFCVMLKYIRDRKWYIYFPLCILAVLEHNGAYVLFPMYFINHLPTSKKFIRNFALIMAPTWFFSSMVDLSDIIMQLGDFMRSTKAEKWVSDTETISFFHTMECYAVVILILIFYKKIISNKRSREVKLVLQLFLVTVPIFTLFHDWIILTRIKDYFTLMYGIILGYIVDDGTTDIISDRIGGYWGERSGVINARLIAAGIFIVCYIGMVRYVVAFDNGVLWDFTSFITQGVSVFA